MVNQSTPPRRRISDCSPVRSIMRKNSNNGSPEYRPCKRVSFAVHCGRCTSWSNPQCECDRALIEPPKSHRDGTEVSSCRLGSLNVDGIEDAVFSSVLEASIRRPKEAGTNRERSPSLLFEKVSPGNSSSCINYPTEFSHDSTRSGENNIQSVLRTNLCPKNGPSKDIAWCGAFEVVDCGKIRMCEAVISHISKKVSRKAFELSKKIAPLLQFKLHPRMDFYPEIFQEVCPDRDDIALYFYPTKQYEKSRKQYSDLLKDMEMKDLVLRSQMDNTELLVFPSTVLHVNSNMLGRSYFMWGVFRRRKDEYEAAQLTFKVGEDRLRTNCGA